MLAPDCTCHQGRLVERSKGKGTKLCVAVYIEQKQTIMHYQPVKKRQFLKIVLATPTMVTQARGDLLETCLGCSKCYSPNWIAKCVRSYWGCWSSILCATCCLHAATTASIPTVCVRTGILEQGVYIESLNMSRGFTTYESNVLFALRFMIDHDVVGGNWVELPAGVHTYQGPASSNKLSHCQMEAHIHCSKLVSHKPEGMLEC